MRLLHILGRTIFRMAQGVWYAAVGVFAVFAVGLIVVLIGSLAYHAVIRGDLGHEGKGQAVEQSSPGIDPNPVNQYGEPSYEFEPEDIERAEEGYEDEALREYCEEAVSEAQEVGCLSHVDPSEVP